MMKVFASFMDWPLRIKIALLLVTASLLPLAIMSAIDLRDARENLHATTEELLAARGDQLADQLDTFHAGYKRSAEKYAHFPQIIEFCQAGAADAKRLAPAVRALLDVQPASDANVRVAALLNLSGTVTIASDDMFVDLNEAGKSYIREALQGKAVISDVFLSVAEAEFAPTIAYVAPVRGSAGRVIGLMAISVRATALWDVARSTNELAGPRSFAVVFDHYGIRIAHTYNDDIVFHPGGPLDPATVENLVAERRFGQKTRQLLQDVRAFPAQFERARSDMPDRRVFHGFAPVNQTWNYGVARRMTTVPWTVFYMIPDEKLSMLIAEKTRAKTIFAIVIILLALIVGALFAAVILKPILSLSKATVSIAAGNLAARVPLERGDELGRLGASFNAMAEQIESQATALQGARDELEVRVQQRTAELLQTTEDLKAEIAERERAEKKIQAQLARLNLLHQITRAIGERQDLRSIFQVVVRSLEDQLPIDFGCVCLYNQADQYLTVTSVGVRSESLAMALAMPEQARIAIDENGLSRCVRGELVYEPDIGSVAFPFPQRLAQGGLRALVVAPLLVESSVFGILVAARKNAKSFSSGDCEFLRQLSEHIALAVHQGQLYGALQQAYDDLRQTQQSVMQQERLRSLGQMASGIAHDINNAISPVTLYTESLLESETNLSDRARRYLQTIQRAVEDVAQTVARMREFYRHREPQLTLTRVRLNPLIQQIVELTRARWHDMPQQRGVVIDVQTDLAPNLPDIMGIESEIREALINLVFNAVDAMPEGGTITLRTRPTGNAPAGAAHREVCVDIVDGGVGMDDETRQHCLEPFYTTKGDRGTGLGLAMVFGTVQRHGGTIDISSEPAKGTTITLGFPVATKEGAGAPSLAPMATPPRMRILVVDDDPLLLRSLIDILEADGHIVISANHGQAGIDAFTAAQQGSTPFEAVITDLGMPQIDGRKVAAAVKHASPATPVILLTGWGQRLVADGEIPAYVDVVLGKPPKLRELREALIAVRSART